MLVNFIIIASLILIIVVELKFNSLTHLWFYSCIKQLVISLNAKKEKDFMELMGDMIESNVFLFVWQFFTFLSRYYPNTK